MNSAKKFSILVYQFLFVSILAQADILDNWHWRSPVPFADTMYSVCFGAGKFVAVGEGGVIHTSTDGITWETSQRPVISSLNRVAFLNGQFIAVGDSGAIVTSPDGVTWVPRVSGTANSLLGVTYGNGTFVCCGVGGQLVRSTNGIDWTLGSRGSSDLGWITFGNGLFVITNSGLSVSISADSQNWTSIGLPSSGNDWPHSVSQVEFGNGMFIAAAKDDTGNPYPPGFGSFFYRSSDGTNWTKGAMMSADPHSSLTYLNGAFHESGGTLGPVLVVTVDGDANIFTVTPPAVFRSMTFGNGRYVSVSENGSTWYSTNETNWTAAASVGGPVVWDLVQGSRSNLLAVGPMSISSDGTHFSGSNAPTDQLYAGASDGTNYVVVGGITALKNGFSKLYTSTNGVDWVQRTANSGYGLTSVCYVSNRWVAVGGNGTVITSPNTLSWTLRTSGTGSTLNSVAYGNGIYVAVGNSGTVITSPDGTAWDVQFSGTVANLNDVVYQSGQFTAVGSGGTILTSPDAANWTAQNSGTNSTFYTVACGNGSYLVGGYEGIVGVVLPNLSYFLTSTNGTNWENISTKIPTATAVHSVVYWNQSFWILGENGMILQSDAADGIPHLAGAMMTGNGGMKLNVVLNPPAAYRVQFRTNMFTDTWHDVFTRTNPITSDAWTDTNASKLPSGFYRIVSP